MKSSAAVVTNLLADPGFEAITGNEPGTNTVPWFTVNEGNSDFHIASTTDQAHSGAQSVRYTFYFAKGAVVQNLDVQLESNKTYEVSAWLRIGEPSANAIHTNAPSLNMGLYTSPTNGGTYSYKAVLRQALNSTEDTWEQFKATFSGDAYDGEYVQIRFNKVNESTTHRIFMDDVEFGEYEPDPPPPAPEGMLIGWHGSILTNDYAATGIGGTLFTNEMYRLSPMDAGSTDGTYGTIPGAPEVPALSYEVRLNTTNAVRDSVVFSIENNTGGPLQLDSIHFDYGRFFAGGPQDIALLYASGDLSGITNNTVINSYSGATQTGRIADYDDFDWSLAGLPDRTLADGESAGFKLVASNASNAQSSGAFDNIAIFGGVPDFSYDAWADAYGIGGPGDDDDGDGLSNLYEFGLGGDPTNSADLGYVPVVATLAAGGTNWFEYVHARRISPDNGLVYHLEQNTDLVYGTWTNSGNYFEVGTGTLDADFESVTNRIPTTGKQKEYIRLVIEQE